MHLAFTRIKLMAEKLCHNKDVHKHLYYDTIFGDTKTINNDNKINDNIVFRYFFSLYDL